MHADKTQGFIRIALIAILFIAIFLRFYNAPFRYSLGVETVRDAVVGIEGARNLQFPLTGAFSSLGPFTFGPWYQYQLILFSLLTPSLFAPWIYLGITSVLYVFILYKIGKLVRNSYLGLILAYLSAISPSQIISATHLTSHNNTHLFAALSIYIFLLIFSKRVSYWWGFFLGLFIGIGINLHFQMSGLLILPLILLIYKRREYQYFLCAIGGLLVSFLPLLFFEFNNHWFTTRNLWYYILHGKNAIYVPNRWLFYLRDFWPLFWSDVFGVPNMFGTMIVLGVVAFLGWAIYTKRVEKKVLVLLVAFLFNFIALRYYWGPRFFGYLNFLRPFVYIFTGYTLLSLYKLPLAKFGVWAVIILLTILAYPRILSTLEPDPFSREIYQAVRDIRSKYPKDTFTLYTCSKSLSGSYESASYSLLFGLELEKRYNRDGHKIGLQKDCELSKIDSLLSSQSSSVSTGLGIEGLEILDFSKVSLSKLQASGWQGVSFARVYDANARWWFHIQP